MEGTMKKQEYYASTLVDLKKEVTRQTRLISGLNAMHDQLECQGYAPLDPLDAVIKDLEGRRKTVKDAVKRIEPLIK
jgi:hypothetical protein